LIKFEHKLQALKPKVKEIKLKNGEYSQKMAILTAENEALSLKLAALEPEITARLDFEYQ